MESFSAESLGLNADSHVFYHRTSEIIWNLRILHQNMRYMGLRLLILAVFLASQKQVVQEHRTPIGQDPTKSTSSPFSHVRIVPVFFGGVPPAETSSKTWRRNGCVRQNWDLATQTLRKDSALEPTVLIWCFYDMVISQHISTYLMGEKQQANLDISGCQSLSLQAVPRIMAPVGLGGWDQLKARPEPRGRWSGWPTLYWGNQWRSTATQGHNMRQHKQFLVVAAEATEKLLAGFANPLHDSRQF